MGMFDTYYAPCPKCGVLNAKQDKTGPCVLGDFTLDRANSDKEVAMGFDGLRFVCESCGAKYKTINKSVPKIVVEFE